MRRALLLAGFLVLGAAQVAQAHGGGLDQNGGHYCREAGYRSGKCAPLGSYHCHQCSSNAAVGTSSSGGSGGSSTAAAVDPGPPMTGNAGALRVLSAYLAANPGVGDTDARGAVAGRSQPRARVRSGAGRGQELPVTGHPLAAVFAAAGFSLVEAGWALLLIQDRLRRSRAHLQPSDAWEA